MWLPKKERILLIQLYSKVDEYRRSGGNLSELENLLREQIKQAKEQIDEIYVMNVIKSLRKYGLIEYHHKERNTGYIDVELTKEGINLGRKYSSKIIGPFGVWVTEYLWLFIILSLAVGIITLLVTIFKD